jgi:PKD repeat protein
MKSFFIFSLSLAVILFSAQYSAQCTVDQSYTVAGIYPNPLPIGYTGQPYSEDITFVMPVDTSGATINNFEIVSIALPVGLSWECNNAANGCNYNPQDNVYGCINVYGTPILAGTYEVEVSILVDVTASGTNIDNIPVPFFVTLEIQTPAIGNSGFISNPPSGCLPLEVAFTNNNPGLLYYEWDFGNGANSNDESPVNQFYSEPGTYAVQYAAYNNIDTLDNYTLTEVTILNVSENWLGQPWGWEPLNGNNPDPYFQLLEDGDLIYQSGYEYNNDGPITWSVNINMDPTKQYKIKVMDADETAAQTNAAEITYGGDDECGNHIMNFSSCSSCGAGSYANVAYNIAYQEIFPVPSVQSIDTILVGSAPGIPNIVYDSTAYTVSTDSSQYILQWSIDSSFWTNHTDALESIDQTGFYYVTAFSPLGCSTTSDSVFVIYCDTTLVFEIEIDGAENLYVPNLPDGYGVQWYLDGVEISGATSYDHQPNENGDYVAYVYDSLGCDFLTAPFVYYNDASIQELQSDWWCYPNPAQSQFVVMWPDNMNLESLTLFNMEGRLMYTADVHTAPQIIDISRLSNGMYMLFGEGEKGVLKKRVVVRH